MKLVIAVALMATSFPGLAVAMGRTEPASNERRVCTQISVRAGSRMSGRRICRTPTEWREALGADWRQHLGGARGVQDDYEAMMVRVSPDNGVHGIQPRSGGIGRGGGGGPR